jgi:hypothetical protein
MFAIALLLKLQLGAIVVKYCKVLWQDSTLLVWVYGIKRSNAVGLAPSTILGESLLEQVARLNTESRIL